MKKNLIIALAGMMLFAFTQCGDDGKDTKKDGENKGKKETISGSKEYAEALDALKRYEKALDKVKDCEDMDIALNEFRLAEYKLSKKHDEFGSDTMTLEEKEKFRKQADVVYTKEENKAKELNCY